MLDLRRDLQAFPTSIVLHGQVDAPTGYAGPVVIVARFREPSAGVPEQSLRLERPGPFEFVLGRPPDSISAYGERGGGADPSQSGELCAAVELPSASEADTHPLQLELGSQGASCASRRLDTDAAMDSSRMSRMPESSTGKRVAPDDEVLSASFAHESYWEPGRYLREKGGDVYLLEAYDPARIPILFVHGAAGSAQDWKYFFNRIDRRRFQPWVYVYASGAPLSVSADILNWRLKALQARYHYAQLCITAHSMGGLIVRKLLLEPLDRPATDVLFVSLSTPWGGDDGAAIGVRFAPVTVPSWEDLNPAGRFLAGLYARRLADGVTHHLYFGYRRSGVVRRASGDGVIALTSQLAAAAQNEARSIVGFDADHDGILRSPEVLDRYDALLEAWATGREKPLARSEQRAAIDLGPPHGEPVTPQSLAAP